MSDELKNENALVFSYLVLRKAIGYLGTLLPVLLAIGAVLLFRTGLQSSVSSYYYTGMRDVFVGTLFAIGFFLFSYKGYGRPDNLAGNVGWVSAVGAALFPTAPDEAESLGFSGIAHFVFAAVFLLTLIYFSLFLFTKTDPDKPPTRRKLQRNMVYKVSGYVMSLCIVLIVVYFLLPDQTAAPLERLHPVFWLEAVAVVAFGISWLTKGEAILGD